MATPTNNSCSMFHVEIKPPPFVKNNPFVNEQLIKPSILIPPLASLYFSHPSPASIPPTRNLHIHTTSKTTFHPPPNSTMNWHFIARTLALSVIFLTILSQIFDIPSYFYYEYTDLEYLDTPKLEADLHRITTEINWMHNTVMQPDDLLCGNAKPDSRAFAFREVHVDLRNDRFEKKTREGLRALAEMEDALLVPMVLRDSGEVYYVLGTRRRVRKAVETADTLLKKMQLQAYDLEAACAWVMTA